MHEYTYEQIEELRKCMKDVVYFAETYCKVIHPIKGLISLELYPHQKEVLKALADNDLNIFLACRQSGKTVAQNCFLLWYSNFSTIPKTNMLISNKQSSAANILDDIYIMYENLPDWMKIKLTVKTKLCMEFETGTTIRGMHMHKQVGQGEALSSIFFDECAYYNKKEFKELWISLYPIICTGGKVCLTSSASKADGIFYETWIDAIEGKNDFKAMEIKWSDIPGRDGQWADTVIKNIGDECFQREFLNKFV